MTISRTAPPVALRAAFLAALLLAACGGGEEETETGAPPPSATEETAPPAREPSARVTEVLGTFDGQVTGLALWAAPSAAQSVLYAANGEAGLYAIPLNAGSGARASAEGDLGVLSLGAGPGGELLAAARDEEIVFYAADGGPEIVAVGRLDVGGEIGALCFDDRLAGITSRYLLAEIGDDWEILRVVAENGEVSAERMPAEGPEIEDCVGGAGLLALVDGEGSDGEGWYRANLLIDDQDDRRALTLGDDRLSPAETTMAAGLVSADGDPTPVFLLETGELLVNGERIAIDGELTGTLVDMAASGGNLGGVFRAGALAVLTEGGSVGLVPWLTVENALGD